MNVDVSKKIFSEPTFVKDLSEYGQIMCIEISPFEWNQDIVLVGFQDKVLLIHLSFEETLKVDVLNEFEHPGRVSNLALSPETSLNVLPNIVLFCAASSDFKLRVFNSDLLDNTTCKVLAGHSNYINDIKFDSENSFLASASDDNTVKVWQVEDFTLSCSFNLSSPGMSISWHRSEGSKLMVAEKNGIIRFYNVKTKVPIISLDNGKPLSSAHWSPGDCEIIASLQFGELFLWEITKPCLPLKNTIIFPENGGFIKLNSKGDFVGAVNSLDGTLKVIQVDNNSLKLTASVTLPTNICWHYRYPVICIGDDSKLCFWKVPSKFI